MNSTGALTGTHEVLAVAMAAVVGLFVGSFLNVVVYRAPLGLSVSTPRSFCPTCDRQLSWWENVPLVSWLALRGRCHTCHEPISVRYPLVEASTAVSFALVAWAWHGSAIAAGYCVFAATAISVSLIEFGGARAPLSVAAIGVGIGQVIVMIAAVWLGHWAAFGWSLGGLVIGSLAFGVLRGIDPDCRDPRWFGRSLLPVVGCWLGGLAGSGARGPVAGLAAWILTEFVCLVVVWVAVRQSATAGAPVVTSTSPGLPIAGVPLVTGVLVAMVVSLAVAA